MAERQQVNQTSNRVVPTRPQQARGHPKRHWQDDLDKAIGQNLSHVAKDRHCWTESREGFLQQE